jgi:hypothetical protein
MYIFLSSSSVEHSCIWVGFSDRPIVVNGLVKEVADVRYFYVAGEAFLKGRCRAIIDEIEKNWDFQRRYFRLTAMMLSIVASPGYWYRQVCDKSPAGISIVAHFSIVLRAGSL